MVRIDREKCIGCGNCRKDCFGRNIEWKDGKAQVIGDCFKCGHCVAVCPVEAVTITDYPAMDEFKGTSEIEPENLLHMMQFRRSIRNYKNKAVEQEKLDFSGRKVCSDGGKCAGCQIYCDKREFRGIKADGVGRFDKHCGLLGKRKAAKSLYQNVAPDV